jgi:hypothetical protein
MDLEDPEFAEMVIGIAFFPEGGAFVLGLEPPAGLVMISPLWIFNLKLCNNGISVWNGWVKPLEKQLE